MTARRISLLVALFTMAASGWYVAVYLARWEWNRALMAGVIFVAAEVALLGVLLFDRMARLERRLDQRSSGGDDPRRQIDSDPRVLTRVRAAARPPGKPFAWLSKPPSQMSVFIPVLLGAGVLLSGAAWAVERVARLVGGRTFDRRLAGKLDTLALPPGGLLDPDQPDPFWPAS